MRATSPITISHRFNAVGASEWSPLPCISAVDGLIGVTGFDVCEPRALSTRSLLSMARVNRARPRGRLPPEALCGWTRRGSGEVAASLRRSFPYSQDPTRVDFVFQQRLDLGSQSLGAPPNASQHAIPHERSAYCTDAIVVIDNRDRGYTAAQSRGCILDNCRLPPSRRLSRRVYIGGEPITLGART
jgi:hypothetical protein